MVVLGEVAEECLAETKLYEVIKDVPEKHISKFVKECLKIPEATFNDLLKIKSGSAYDTLKICMVMWRNKIECEGNDSAEGLHKVQQHMRELIIDQPTTKGKCILVPLTVFRIKYKMPTSPKISIYVSFFLDFL